MAWRDWFRWGRKAAGSYDVLRELVGGGARSKSGRVVTPSTAVEVSAVFACLRVIGNGVAQVPLKLMRESPDGKTRLPERKHPLYELAGLRPNPWQTAFEFWQMLSWHVELCGEFFAFINRGSRGQILELIPFEPSWVTVKRADDFTLSYEVRSPSGKVQAFPAQAIWHVRGPTWNGWRGLETLRLAREAVGLAMATEESQASMHRNGLRAAGVWSVEGTLTKPQYDALREFIDREHLGPDKAGGYLLLDRAAKWSSTQMSGVDAQHLETRREQVAEVCRFFGVLPIMVGYADKTATFASAEAFFLAHLVHCLSPRWTAYEQSLNANLLAPAERAEGLYFDFVEEGMARGSMKDTKDTILGYVNGGVMTPNEGRAKLDLNPDADPASDRLRVPVNVAQEPEAGGDPPAGSAGEGGDAGTSGA